MTLGDVDGEIELPLVSNAVSRAAAMALRDEIRDGVPSGDAPSALVSSAPLTPPGAADALQAVTDRLRVRWRREQVGGRGGLGRFEAVGSGL